MLKMFVVKIKPGRPMYEYTGQITTITTNNKLLTVFKTIKIMKTIKRQKFTSNVSMNA